MHLRKEKKSCKRVILAMINLMFWLTYFRFTFMCFFSSLEAFKSTQSCEKRRNQSCQVKQIRRNTYKVIPKWYFFNIWDKKPLKPGATRNVSKNKYQKSNETLITSNLHQFVHHNILSATFIKNIPCYLEIKM